MEETSFAERFSIFAGFNLIFFPFFYFWLTEAIFGKTIGKFFTRTHVINLTDRKLNFIDCLFRTIIRFTILDVFTILLKSGRIPWHDSFTHTRVVTDDYLRDEFV